MVLMSLLSLLVTSHIILKIFYNYNLRLNSVEFNLSSGNTKIIGKKINWKIKVIDTGTETMTGGRILNKKIYW